MFGAIISHLREILCYNIQKGNKEAFMGYQILLADIDNTLLDFVAGSHAALREMMEAVGVP